MKSAATVIVEVSDFLVPIKVCKHSLLASQHTLSTHHLPITAGSLSGEFFVAMD